MKIKAVWRMFWRAFLLCLDVAGFLALRFIGVESKSAPAQRERQNGRASDLRTTTVPMVPAALEYEWRFEPPHCPRCTELLEDLGTHLVCNGCDSSWTATPEGLVPGRLKRARKQWADGHWGIIPAQRGVVLENLMRSGLTRDQALEVLKGHA